MERWRMSWRVYRQGQPSAALRSSAAMHQAAQCLRAQRASCEQPGSAVQRSCSLMRAGALGSWLWRCVKDHTYHPPHMLSQGMHQDL